METEDNIENQIPRNVDWRKYYIVPPVWNQGACGACWAFSATDAVTSIVAIKTGKQVNYSVQQLINCSQNKGNNGCTGGKMIQAFEYIAEFGLVLDEQCPYEFKETTCVYEPKSVQLPISGYFRVTARDEPALQYAISQQPVSVAVDASSKSWQFYFDGVIDTMCGED
jgi:cathepsin L